MGPVAIRSQYGDLFGPTMLPVLEELFYSELEMHPSRREQLFKIVGTDRDIWQSTEIHDLDLFKQMSEGEEYTYTRPKQGSHLTLTVVKYGLGFSISEEMIKDGKFDLVADMTRKLAKSARESQEIQAMNVFNNGFSSQLTADGVSIFNSAHPLPSGGSFRNVLSTPADLSPTMLDQLLSDFETQFVGDSGIIYNLKPKSLLVHPIQKRYARELIGSEGRPDTADNNLNPFLDDGLQVVSSPHLTDQNGVYLLAEPAETGLRIIEREQVQTKSNESFDTDSVKYKSMYREIIGVTQAYGIFGTPGA